MSYLNQVVSGKLQRNKLIMLYGPEGVGKSTFGAQCDSPIFLASEDGTANLDVSRLPTADSWGQVFEMLLELSNGGHGYKTLVVDTLDWLEPLMFSFLLDTHGKKVIEEVGGGYGKYVNVVSSEWRKFMQAIDMVREKMDVVILAHSQVKAFHDPMQTESYDRYQLKLHVQHSSILWKEYVDCLLFANYKTYVKKDGNKAKAFGDGERTVYTTRMPSYDAKNRYGLPDEMEMEGRLVMAAIDQSCGETPENIMGEITMLLDKVKDETLIAKVKATVKESVNNSARLVAIREKLMVKLGE
jgi:hypothetical protein